MLYSSIARFHISIIPIRWYKDNIIAKLDQVLKNSPSLIAIESSTDTIVEVNLNLQSLRNFQSSNYQTTKTAINIALKTKSDNKLVQLLKNFISAKQNPGANNNSNEIVNSEAQDEKGIITLNQHLIDQTSDPHVTKIRDAPRKKRIKSAIEISKIKTMDKRLQTESIT
ncbi:protein far1-related sequence 5-like [Gigaspora margarita]|uniref:Protein far1-related sequence 5-like n=1 Tax=Gigaspora margarita TaxID=4874 RepID=A0A8H3X1Z0_GIGMA|nr:protein far1-related sequence 5-like [Gigaspora margarita]